MTSIIVIIFSVIIIQIFLFSMVKKSLAWEPIFLKIAFVHIYKKKKMFNASIVFKNDRLLGSFEY